MMEEMILPYSEEKLMTVQDKKKYYQNIRDYCEVLSSKYNNKISIGQNMMTQLYLKEFYNKKLVIIGEENIPNDKNVLFLCNHSNSHDVFSMYIALKKIGISTSVMVADDCLNFMSKMVFASADATFINREVKKSANNGIIELSSKLIAGKTGVIFGEATWNLHPTKLMQPLKIGGVKIATISDTVIVPTILEYIEVPKICNKELELYDKIILKFGKPYYVNYTDLVEQTNYIKTYMEHMRNQIWIQNGIDKTSLNSIDPNVYVNHTYLKKFCSFGFKYDSLREFKFIYNKYGTITNEYCKDENGQLVPGITKRYHK